MTLNLFSNSNDTFFLSVFAGFSFIKGTMVSLGEPKGLPAQDGLPNCSRLQGHLKFEMIREKNINDSFYKNNYHDTHPNHF